ncbi:hypothetical protein BC941DRAFT_472494 [Chlamydoabsidia padenii]|nr:hypothetical protein BC941DRAFT_472494 [Chlamydoabsidia padenii]
MLSSQKNVICDYCRHLAIRYSIHPNETTRHDERYVQVIPLKDLEHQLATSYPTLYNIVLSSESTLTKLLVNEYRLRTYFGNCDFMVVNISTLKSYGYFDLSLANTQLHDLYFLATPIATYQPQQQPLSSSLEVPGFEWTVDRLSQEMDAIYKSLLPTQQTLTAHSDLISKINKLLETVWYGQGYKVHAFGSSVTKLLLDGSDLDLSIVLPNDQSKMGDYRQEIQSHQTAGGWPASIFDIGFLSNKLTQYGIKNVKTIHALVSICKFMDPATKLKCDLSIHNTLDIENSHLIKAYINLDNRIRPFLYLLKHFTKCRHINDAISGTLSSYGFILLGLYYLMNTPVPVIPNLQDLPSHIHCYAPQCAAKIYSEDQGNRLFLYRGKINQLNIFYHNCITSVHDPIQHIPLLSPTPSKTTTTTKRTTDDTHWQSENISDLTTLLIGFFTFYATFNTRDQTVGIGKANHRRKPKNDKLVIYDPFITSRNVAAACTKMGWRLIKSEFKRASCMLRNGSTFANVCRPPNLRSRLYDPHCIRNRANFTEG